MRFLLLVLLGLIATLPVRAEPSTLLTALDQIPADPALWGNTRIVDMVDLDALKQVAGVNDGVRFTDFAARKLGEADEAAVTTLVWRLHSASSFIPYLLTGAENWPKQLGVDFLQLDWFSESGTPPNALLLLGGEAVPQGEGLAVLKDAGLATAERGGVTAWAKGENDNAIDMMGRDPGFPFWGWLGMSVRLFRGEDALVGTRSWADFDLALAVERGEADSLADLPRFQLAAEVLGHPDYSAGPVLQATFVDETFGAGAIGLAPAADGLPPFELLAFADREDASGHQVVLVLTYGIDAATAAVAADRLAARIAAYKDQGGKSLAESFPELTVTTMPLETASGAAAVARFAIPALPLRLEGQVVNRSILYAHFIRMLYSRDLGFLAPGG